MGPTFLKSLFDFLFRTTFKSMLGRVIWPGFWILRTKFRQISTQNCSNLLTIFFLSNWCGNLTSNFDILWNRMHVFLYKNRNAPSVGIQLYCGTGLHSLNSRKTFSNGKFQTLLHCLLCQTFFWLDVPEN